MSIPLMSASTSSWLRIFSAPSAITMAIPSVLLHHESGEEHGVDLFRFAAVGREYLAHRFERRSAQLFLALIGAKVGGLLVAEQQQQVVADDRVGGLQCFDRL